MSIDIFAVIAGRHSAKRFSNRQVEMDKIMQVIQAGGLAPSSGNIQNWSFLVVTEVEKIRQLYDHTLNQEAFLNAPVAVVVCGDVEFAHTMYGMRGKRLYTVQNCAAAIENMLLAAHALGLGSLWVGAFDEDKVATMFNIPSPKHRPQAIVLLGYADADPDSKEVKPLQDMIYFNAWGNRVLRPHLVYFDWAEEWRRQATMMKAAVRMPGIRDRLSWGSKDQQEAARKEEQHTARETTSMKNTSNVKKRIRDMVDSLKRDEYRKHD